MYINEFVHWKLVGNQRLPLKLLRLFLSAPFEQQLINTLSVHVLIHTLVLKRCSKVLIEMIIDAFLKKWVQLGQCSAPNITVSWFKTLQKSCFVLLRTDIFKPIISKLIISKRQGFTHFQPLKQFVVLFNVTVCLQGCRFWQHSQPHHLQWQSSQHDDIRVPDFNTSQWLESLQPLTGVNINDPKIFNVIQYLIKSPRIFYA